MLFPTPKIYDVKDWNNQPIPLTIIDICKVNRIESTSMDITVYFEQNDEFQHIQQNW